MRDSVLHDNYQISNYECVMSGQHEEIETCKCGQNKICYTCGHGSGALPCLCPGKPLRLVESEILDG